MTVARVTILPVARIVGTSRNDTECRGVRLGLMQNVRELVVHRVELTLVEQEHVFSSEVHTLGHRTHIIHVDERNLHTSRSITQRFRTRGGTICGRADKVEDTGAISLHEDRIAIMILLTILVIYLIEKVLDEVREQLRLLVVGRSQLITEVRGREVEPVLDFGVVRHYEIVVQPLIERCSDRALVNSSNIGIEDRLGEVLIISA